jgi:hypothetical protein
MIKYRLLILVLFLAITLSELKGEGGKLEDLDYNYRQFNSIIYLSSGFVLSSGSKDFFNHYKTFLKGNKTDFMFFPIINIGTKFQFLHKFRFGLETEFTYAQMKDAYIEELPGYDKKGYRALSQDFTVKSFPSFITAEFIPVQQQFRSYFGIGIGAVFSDIIWNELLSSSDPFDKRQAGEHYNEFGIYPNARIYAGLELGFDKFGSENFVGSFTFEIKYTAMYRYVPIFSTISNQFDEKPEGIMDKYSILPGYLGIYAGLTFNFNRRIK